MRTRFLNTDYFTSSPVETLSFLSLPVANIVASRQFSFNKDDLLRFESVPELLLEIERLPIDAALWKFSSDVIPGIVEAEYEDFEVNWSPNGNGFFDEQRSFSSGGIDNRFSEKEAEVLYKEKEVDSKRALISESREVQFPKVNEIAVVDKDMQRFHVIQFETPELDILLKNTSFFEGEEIQIFHEVPEIENDLGTVKAEVIMQYPNEVHGAIYSVDCVSSEYSTEQNTSLVETDGYYQDQMPLQHGGFPRLEVGEISLTLWTSMSVDHELLSLLENIKPQNWNKKDYLLINRNELLGSMDYDIFEFLSDDCQSKLSLDSQLAQLDMFVETDIINMVKMSQIAGISSFYQEKSDVDYSSSMGQVIFEEFQIFELDISQNFEQFICLQITEEPETCDWMFRDGMNFKNFNELIVSHELVLGDDVFKSLPIPVLSHHEKIKPLYAIIEEILFEQTPQPLSASDGIYLDWHLLEEDKCNHKIYSSYPSMFKDIVPHNIDFDWEPLDYAKLVFDFIFRDDALKGSDTEGYIESPCVHSDGVSMHDCHFIRVTSGHVLDRGQQPDPGNEEPSAEINAERTSLLFKSMSTFNDLDFFLNPREAVVGRETGFVTEASDAKAEYPEVPSSTSKASVLSCDRQLKQWDIIFHNVKLSDGMVALIDNFKRRYLAILQDETDLSLFLPPDDFKLLSLPIDKLMDCIKKKFVRRSNSCAEENMMTFVTLCVIKQMAWYMCFYGIHITYLYLEKLCQSLDSLKSRLGFLYSLIEGAYGVVDKEITSSHPSLAVVQQILQSKTSKSSLKVLISADQVFWGSLKRLLRSMGLSCTELHSFYTRGNQQDVCEVTEFTKAKRDALSISDCLLVSHEQLSASFPFDKFRLILEYGGSYGSSRISSPSRNFSSLPHLHLIKVELDNSSASTALCEGAGMPQRMKMSMVKESNSVKALDEIMHDQGLEDLLNFVPIEDKSNTRCRRAAGIEASCIPLQSAMEPKLIQQSVASPSNTVVIVNTQNFIKEMIISRRSTYQKILALEKEGLQVVERDSDLPVDLVLSSAIGVVWYDCRNIGEKASALVEASSRLLLCIENIATTTLTLLSFTFSCCILVFEGESTFLSTVMESSDELYAAAANLGIDLQLFCSYSADLTDEIILGCIEYAAKLTRGLYPKMPESETYAESFLTKFPSLNPLTAHAILSSGEVLNQYLELPHEQRIHAVQKYYVPDGSITLFSASCRYGEREDSKSIMTECSSSVSSGPDSDQCHFNVDCERKRKAYIGSPQKIDKNSDNFFRMEPLNQFKNGTLNLEILDDRKPYSFLDDMYGEKLGFDLAIKNNTTSTFSGAYACQIYEGPQVPNERQKQDITSKDKFMGQNQGREMASKDSFPWRNINISENLQEDFTGEIVDLTGSPLSGEDISAAANSMDFSFLGLEMDEYCTRKSKIARRLSFGRSSHPNFPSAAEINTSPDMLRSVKHPRQNFRRINDNPDTDGNNERLPLSHQKSLLQVLKQRSGGSQGLSFKEEISYCSGTPLSNAIHSANPQLCSPWTIHFLNRIREKSRLRQQSLPPDVSAPCFVASGNVSKVTKRKSPSILEYFKYQGCSPPSKILERKKKKQCIQSSNSLKKGRTSASLLSSCTPIDKKARQTLSFTMDGNERQTKLVWSDGSAHGLNKRCWS